MSQDVGECVLIVEDKKESGVKSMLQDEWKLLYETWYKPLYLYALSLTGNSQDAEDLLQETFVQAYLAYRDVGSIKYWLITVLRNRFLNLQRKRRKELLDEGEIFLTQKAEGMDILVNLIAQEERRQLFLEIQRLPLKMREVLMESVYFQMKDDEIGRLHGITAENVRKIRSRAKQRLIEKMKEEN